MSNDKRRRRQTHTTMDPAEVSALRKAHPEDVIVLGFDDDTTPWLRFLPGHDDRPLPLPPGGKLKSVYRDGKERPYH